MKKGKLIFVGLALFFCLIGIYKLVLAQTSCYFKGPETSPDLLRLSSLDISGNGNLLVGDTVTVGFNLQNYGQSDIKLGSKGIFAAGFDPSSSDASFGFSYANAILKPGQTVSFKASRVLDKEGVWTIWPSYQIVSGKTEKLGPDNWRACPLSVAAAQKDSDQDGVYDESDNCPSAYNPNQEDIDGDKIGDACDGCDDRDWDQDKIKNCSDKCPDQPEIFNQYQDEDGCPDEKPQETKDSDQDGVDDSKDNCPNAYNPDQKDGNSNNQGDACEQRTDGQDLPEENKESPVSLVTGLPAETAGNVNLNINASRVPTEEISVPCDLSGTIWNFKYLSKTLKVRICEAERIGGGCLPTPPFTCTGGAVSCKEGGASWLENVSRVWTGEEAYRNPGPLSYRARVGCGSSYLITPSYEPFEQECQWQGRFSPTRSNFVNMSGTSQTGYDFNFTANELTPPSVNMISDDVRRPATFKGEGNFKVLVNAFDASGIKNIKITGSYTVKYFSADETGPLETGRGDETVTVDRSCSISPCDVFLPYYAGGKQISFDLHISACDNNGNKIETTYNHVFPDNSGDLVVAATDPVQVIYDAPLVKNKNTAFRIKVNSTFPYPTEAKFRLDLPPDKWSMTSRSGSYLLGFTPGWRYKDLWGPIKIPANARNHEIMLPIIADWQKELDYDSTADREGKVLRGREVSGVWGLDVRLLPIPAADRVNYSVSIDPENQISETNERNNIINSVEYSTAKTKAWRFLFIPYRDGSGGGMCAPTEGMRQGGAKRQLEYVLATFPIAENKIEYGFSYTNFSLGCGGDPDGQCEYARAFNVSRGEFLRWMARLALDEGYDFGVAIGCGGGGGAGGSDKAVFIGADGNEALLAHEFNHVVSPVSDVYSRDCYSSWNESYCEKPDGQRFYCCWQDYNDEKDRRESNGVDPMEGCTVDCGQNETSGCDGACCHARCQPGCAAAGGVNYYAPDLRIDLPATNGFWANEWQKKESKQYFMDGPRGDNWMTARSVRDSGFSFCPSPDINVDYDGYLNLLNNPRFKSASDPQGLLVSGTINKNGTVKFDPFVYLPETFLDLEPNSGGDYQFVLLDENKKELSKSGFDVYFYQYDPGGGPLEETSFAYRIEWKEGTSLIELRNKAGQVLASRQVSKNKPEIEVVYPNGGEVFKIGKKIELNWQASDADGDELFYSLAVSSDGGKSWLPVDMDLKTTSYELNTAALRPGDYLLKVKASDGVNTSQDVSDKTFEVKAVKKIKNLYFLAWGVAMLILLGILWKKKFVRKK
ncbi:MAG: thrombospondin type 3 repeat-containing protein [Patescibacteria group bacterium]